MISPLNCGSSKATTSSWTGPTVMLSSLVPSEREPGMMGLADGHSASEDLRLLSVELLLGQHARVEELLELHQLGVGVRGRGRRCDRGGRARRRGRCGRSLLLLLLGPGLTAVGGH